MMPHAYNILWFHLLKCEFLLLCFVLNIYFFLVLDCSLVKKQRHSRELWEIKIFNNTNTRKSIFSNCLSMHSKMV